MEKIHDKAIAELQSHIGQLEHMIPGETIRREQAQRLVNTLGGNLKIADGHDVAAVGYYLTLLCCVRILKLENI